jgi:monoamine oxidase
MARTPLLRSIRTLAREHAAAERLGIAPSELRVRRAEAAYSRRELLVRGGFLGAALAAAGPAALAGPAQAAPKRGPRIAIVGGGIAGLNAALTLQDSGLASTVYEAADRTGGRMHTDRSGYFANGQVTELCGELIDSDHETILDLCSRFGLALTDRLAAEPPGSTETYLLHGARYPADQADRDFEPVRDAVKADLKAAGYPTTWDSYTPAGLALDNLSVHDWIDSRVPGGHGSQLGALLDAAYNTEYGAETTDQSSLNLVYLLGFQPGPKAFELYGTSDERYHVAGGNEQLTDAIAATLPDVRTAWRMTAVAANADGTVTLSFDSPSGPATVVADRAILTLPFAVLRTLDTSRAGFDARKQTAIGELGAGRNAKLQLQFTSRPWQQHGPWGISDGTFYTDLSIQTGWEPTLGQPGTTGVLVDYLGGDTAGGLTPPGPYSNADDDPKVKQYAKAALDGLELVFPGVAKRWNQRASLSVPALDPNLRLAYSYWRIGQYTSFSGYEGVPQGSIHFAGEHCSQDAQGYMEGGAAEGARAALEVVKALRGR